MSVRRSLVVLGLLILAALVLQCFQPAPPSPTLPGDGPMSNHVSVPDEVEALLRQACYDCHSGETRWPWYSRISPLSWLIVRDVQHGRSNLDFSRWSTDPVREPTPDQRLRWICEDMEEGEMPPALYLLAHPEARLEEEEQDLICAWTVRARREVGAESADIR
jgi:hypothetical protein